MLTCKRRSGYGQGHQGVFVGLFKVFPMFCGHLYRFLRRLLRHAFTIACLPFM